MKTKYKDWTLIDWDGNTELNYKCYRKSFRNGCVSVGVGNFHNIVFSFGANSDYSMSSTRWNTDSIQTEKEAMQMVDSNDGYCIPSDNPNFGKRNKNR